MLPITLFYLFLNTRRRSRCSAQARRGISRPVGRAHWKSQGSLAVQDMRGILGSAGMQDINRPRGSGRLALAPTSAYFIEGKISTRFAVDLHCKLRYGNKMHKRRSSQSHFNRTKLKLPRGALIQKLCFSIAWVGIGGVNYLLTIYAIITSDSTASLYIHKKPRTMFQGPMGSALYSMGAGTASMIGGYLFSRGATKMLADDEHFCLRI